MWLWYQYYYYFFWDKIRNLIIRNPQDNNNNIKEFTNYIYVERVIKVLSKVLLSCSSVCHTVYVQSNTAYTYRQQEKRKRRKFPLKKLMIPPQLSPPFV